MIGLFSSQRRLPTVLLILATLASCEPALAAVMLRKQLTLAPPVGANDLHLEIYQKEASADLLAVNIVVDAGQPPNTNSMVGLIQNGPIPAGNNFFGGPAGPFEEQNATTWVEAGIETMAGGGGPPFVNPLKVTITATLKSKNTLRTRGFWTANGIPGDVIGPAGGPQIGPAFPVPLLGVGMFKHCVSIFNDGDTAALFEEVSFLVSDTQLDFSSITFPAPVISSQVVDPGESLAFCIVTDGSQLGSFIYLSYDGTGSGLQHVLFEHPVNEVVPEPSTFIIWSLLGALGITVGWWRRRRKGV